MRCERGADIARAIDLDEDAAAAIRQLDEHWDGHGYPGEPAPARRSRCWRAWSAWRRRWRSSGSRAAPPPPATSPASAAARGSTPRSSTPSTPSSATAPSGPRCDDARRQRAGARRPRRARRRRAPGPRRRGLRADRRRQVAVHRPPLARAWPRSPRASPSTMGHDARDAAGSCAAPRLLHDVGKLGVSNLILDKPGKLDDRRVAAPMRRHPRAVAGHPARACRALADVARLRRRTTSASTAAATPTA